MNVHEFFIHCEKLMPGKVTPLRRTSFALRRALVDTMEKLCEMKREQPEKLAYVRDIGVQSLVIIDEVIGFYEGKETEGDGTAPGPNVTFL